MIYERNVCVGYGCWVGLEYFTSFYFVGGKGVGVYYHIRICHVSASCLLVSLVELESGGEGGSGRAYIYI